MNGHLVAPILCIAAAVHGGNAGAQDFTPPKVAAAPLTTAHQTYWFIRLDGRWYDVGPPSGYGLFISVSFIGVQAFTAKMSNCRRANGLPLDYSPEPAFWYGPAQYPLYQIRYPIKYNFSDPTGAGILFLDVKTIPGDVICTGEVPDPVGDIPDPPPPPPPPIDESRNRIHHDGFEEYRIFSDNFEG